MALRPRNARAQAPHQESAPTSGDTPDKFLLKDYHPRSIYRTRHDLSSASQMLARIES
jgi:hypothetical protein